MLHPDIHLLLPVPSFHMGTLYPPEKCDLYNFGPYLHNRFVRTKSVVWLKRGRYAVCSPESHVIPVSRECPEGERAAPAFQDVDDGMLSAMQISLEVAEHVLISPHGMTRRWPELLHLLRKVLGVVQRLTPDSRGHMARQLV